MTELLELKKKRLLYRSLNRGCKETDLLLTKFASKYLEQLSEAETMLYQQFLDEYDGDIYNWLCSSSPFPEEYLPLAQMLKRSCEV